MVECNLSGLVPHSWGIVGHEPYEGEIARRVRGACATR